LSKDVDIVITHGPPHGVLDRTREYKRAGCPDLFAAVATARPLVHCFGHIHEGWGAKKVTWRDDDDINNNNQAGKIPSSHFTCIDNDKSELIESLATLRPRKFGCVEEKRDKEDRLEELGKRGYVQTRAGVRQGTQTLFVNAAVEEVLRRPDRCLGWWNSIFRCPDVEEA
jgi:hypothetical protein